MAITVPASAALWTRNFVTERGATIFSATSAKQNYPARNLLSPRRSKKWLSDDTTEQRIVGGFREPLLPTCFGLIDSNVETSAAEVSAALAKATVWLKADTLGLADAAAVTSWASVGSNTTPFTQGTGSAQPTQRTNILDGKSIVRFDGNDWLDRGATLELGTKHTIIYVFKYGSISTNQMWLGQGNVSFIDYKNSTTELRYANNVNTAKSVTQSFTTGLWHTVRVVRDGASVSFFVDGVQVGSTQTYTGADITSGFGLRYIGASSSVPSNPSNGDLAEVFISSDSTFSLADGKAVEDYLRAKWTVEHALGSVLVELANDTAFTSSRLAWVLQSYAQAETGILRWYPAIPDNAGAVIQATWNDPAYLAAGAYKRPYWRLTLPAGGVVDSDGDGEDDTFFRIGCLWLGTYVDFIPESGARLQLKKSSIVSRSRSGAAYRDQLPSYYAGDFDMVGLSLSDAHGWLDRIRALGGTDVVVDLHAKYATDATAGLTRHGLAYGNIEERGGADLRLAGGENNDVSVSFEESTG